jgi:hypothetical protein
VEQEILLQLVHHKELMVELHLQVQHIMEQVVVELLVQELLIVQEGQVQLLQ